MYEATKAVLACHSSKIVHTDIKPVRCRLRDIAFQGDALRGQTLLIILHFSGHLGLSLLREHRNACIWLKLCIYCICVNIANFAFV